LSRSGIVVRATARRDIDAQYRWLAEQADFVTADRFLDAIDVAFATLAGHPRLGPEVTATHPRLVGMRKWKVTGFPNTLIFYEPRGAGISVVRILDAAQDWWALIETTP